MQQLKKTPCHSVTASFFSGCVSAHSLGQLIHLTFFFSLGQSISLSHFSSPWVSAYHLAFFFSLGSLVALLLLAGFLRAALLAGFLRTALLLVAFSSFLPFVFLLLVHSLLAASAGASIGLAASQTYWRAQAAFHGIVLGGPMEARGELSTDFGPNDCLHSEVIMSYQLRDPLKSSF